MTPERGRTVVSSFRSGRGTLVLLLAVLMGLTFFYLFSFVRHYLLVKLVRVDLLELREVHETVGARGLLVKDEVLVKAPASGRLQLLVTEGERVRRGAPLARIYDLGAEGEVRGGVIAWSPRAGLVCLRLDGLEGALSPQTVDVLQLERIEAKELEMIKSGAVVEKGSPFCKIIDNLQSLMIYLQLDGASVVPEEGCISLIWNGEMLEGWVLEKRKMEKGVALLLSLDEYPEELLSLRNVDVEVITEKLSGLLVPKRAVVYRGDKPGLYVVAGGRARWVPVTVKGSLSGWLSVSGGGLEPEVRYLSNPFLVREGDIIE